MSRVGRTVYKRMCMSLILMAFVFNFGLIEDVGAVSAVNIALSSGTGTYYTGNSTKIDDSMTVSSEDALTGGSVNINGFVTGDVLTYLDTENVSGSYNASSGILTISGAASASEYQTFLSSVTFSSSSSSGSRTFEILLSNTGSSALYSSSTGHFYEYVGTPTLYWDAAKTAASTKTLSYGGTNYNGYLVTITSSEENAFITQKLGADAWIGASDEASEGTWKWMCGPEYGYALVYTNWNSGEPNNVGTGGENYAEIYCSSETKGRWNDLPNNQSLGYVVEYSNDIGGYINLGSSGSASKTFTIYSMPAPTATTNAASNVTDTSGTLNGTVNAKGTNTTVVFKYGSTIAYGSSVVAAQSPLSTSVDTSVSSSLTGLIPNMTYHYRVEATNGAGTVYGADMTFLTSPSAPVVSSSAASGISPSQATLNGIVNANNSSTTFIFEYGTTTEYGNSVAALQSPVSGASNTAVSHELAGLSPGTTYHYRIMATNSEGSVYSMDSSFTTPLRTATLAGDITDNSVDSDIDITFSEDAIFTASITEISFNGNVLDAAQYTIDMFNNNKITLHPGSAINDYLRTSSTGTVLVKAADYYDSSVSQTITAGVVAVIEFITQPEPGDETGDVFSTPPAIALKDQYGNICINGPSASATVTASAIGQTGDWILGGTTTKSAVQGVADFSGNNLVCTLNSSGTGKMSFECEGKMVESHIFNIPERDSSISLSNANFDHNNNVPEYADIDVEINWNSNTLVSLKQGEDVLTEGIDYEISGNICTIKKEFLGTLPTGASRFTFDFSIGVNPVLDVDITDSSPHRSSDRNFAFSEVEGQYFVVGSFESKEDVDGKVVTTIIVSEESLNHIIQENGYGSLVLISEMSGSDISTGLLTGQMVDMLNQNGANLLIQTQNATYTLPAAQIDMQSIALQFGENVPLSDISVHISISTPSDAMVEVIENTAEGGGYSLVVPAVEYTISCTYGEERIDVSSFNAYVDRAVLIPEGTDPNQITTAIVVRPDGTSYSVPTEIIFDDASGRYYAVIHSLTNSIYAVIYNPVEFLDVENHWAKASVNEMGSRMVVSGVGDDLFEPDRNITRSEFAAIAVRALGLSQGVGEEVFIDIRETDWHRGYVQTAVSYGLISGHGNGTFKPDDLILREEAMIVVSRAMKLTGLAGIGEESPEAFLNIYPDAEVVSSYAKVHAADCIKAGIIKGSDGLIDPFVPVTRAEVAALMQRLLKESKLI
ncbi:MAG: hypothetical protein EOM59_08750 [Clostridia bacterium]|nr:hypothetical protein [Clostridia bacterium]